MDIYDVPIVYEDYIYIREVYGLCQNDTQFDQTLKILALSPSWPDGPGSGSGVQALDT